MVLHDIGQVRRCRQCDIHMRLTDKGDALMNFACGKSLKVPLGDQDNVAFFCIATFVILQGKAGNPGSIWAQQEGCVCAGSGDSAGRW